MKYIDFKGEKISALGLGCMRFPLLDGEQEHVDEAATAEIVDLAIQSGINYFDTAWGYHGGKSELIIGKMLKKYPRESFHLATKFPAIDAQQVKQVADYFEKQLEKCQTDYFDFYLCHNVCERNIDWFTDPEIGIVSYLLEQKKAGRIRHFGFSTHGSRAVIKRFLDAFGQDVEFCQIQLNYLDWQLQSAKEKVELLNNYGVAVWVMEPVRGGRLAELPEKHMAKLQEMRPNTTAPEWAFRFLQGIPGVGVVLSGMSNLQQVRENIQTFSTAEPLTKRENNALLDIAAEMIEENAVPCTACGYCLDRCPRNLPIPELIKGFNDQTKPAATGPESCIGCRSCEALCPQGIKISEVLKQYSTKLKENA